jgi:hypothetical protein
MQFLTRNILVLVTTCLLIQCASDDLGDPTIEAATDAELFAESTANGFSYFQNGNIISKANESPHGNFKLRFNSVAEGALEAGELPASESFPTGSVIVKEVYQNSAVALLAVMKKLPGDPNAGSGWLWAEYQLDGVPLISIESKGSGCVNCHSGTPNRDLVRTFDLH